MLEMTSAPHEATISGGASGIITNGELTSAPTA